MKHITLLFLLFICSVSIYAQATEEQKKTINNIKKNNSYIYAEATLEDQQEAYSLAQELLFERINEYVAKQKEFSTAKETVIVNQNYVTEQIQLPRGNMFRAFLYVKKSDIIAVDNATINTFNKDASSKENEQGASTHSTLSNVKNELLAMKTLRQLQEQLPQLKKKGKIADFASYNKLSNPEDYIIIIYNQAGEVKAVLSEGKERINLISNKPDNIQNYKSMRSAVGVKIK